jgi:hypothetical protein
MLLPLRLLANVGKLSEIVFQNVARLWPQSCARFNCGIQVALPVVIFVFLAQFFFSNLVVLSPQNFQFVSFSTVQERFYGEYIVPELVFRALIKRGDFFEVYRALHFRNFYQKLVFGFPEPVAVIAPTRQPMGEISEQEADKQTDKKWRYLLAGIGAYAGFLLGWWLYDCRFHES